MRKNLKLKLLQGKSSGNFIEEATRIARKYNGSITLATQQLTNYFRDEYGKQQKIVGHIPLSEAIRIFDEETKP
jgi:hypothetical protein